MIRFALLILVCFPACCFAQEPGGFIPPPPIDPPGNDGSLECQHLDVQLGDCSDQLALIDAQIAAKERSIDRRNELLVFAVAKRQWYLGNGEPVPPGVTALILIANTTITELRVDRAFLLGDRQRAADLWTMLWAQYALAGC